MAECPSCSMALRGDETYCLQCGQRLVPEEPPEQGFGVPAAIVGAIAVLAIGGVVFALEQVESDAEKTASREVPVVTQTDQEKSDQKPTDVASWPAGTSAYTVQLASSEDEVSARARATAAVGGGVPAGVLDSDSYPTLEPDRWIVFAGQFDSRDTAAQEAVRYAATGFPDAEAAFISDAREPD